MFMDPRLHSLEADAIHGTEFGSERALRPTFKTAFHLASTRARYAPERRAWPEAMSLVPGR